MQDKEVFLKTVVAHRGQIMATIVATMRNFSDAEDVFQETMAALIEHGDQYDAEREFLPWARGVARNMVRRHYRSMPREELVGDVEDLEYLTDVVTEEDDAQMWEEERRFLRECLAKLSERSRRFFVLRYAGDLRGKELARRTGRSENALRTTLFRIRETVRKCIEKHIQGERTEGLAVHEQGI